MKKLMKWSYLVILPILVLIMDYCIYMQGKLDMFLNDGALFAGALLFHIAVLVMAFTAYSWETKMGLKLKRIRVDFEKVPAIGLAIGFDSGLLLIMPFLVIRFSLAKKKGRNRVKSS